MSEEIKVSEEAIDAATNEVKFLHLESIPLGYFVQNLLNQRDTKIAALEAEAGELKGLLGKTRQYVEDALRRNQEALKDSDPDSQFYGEDICSMPLLSKIDTALNSTKGEK